MQTAAEVRRLLNGINTMFGGREQEVKLEHFKLRFSDGKDKEQQQGQRSTKMSPEEYKLKVAYSKSVWSAIMAASQMGSDSASLHGKTETNGKEKK